VVTVTLQIFMTMVKQSLSKPGGFQEFEVPRFQDILLMKVVRLSALGTVNLYPPSSSTYSWYSFLLAAELGSRP